MLSMQYNLPRSCNAVRPLSCSLAKSVPHILQELLVLTILPSNSPK